MKLGIVGAGKVGAACALAAVTRGSARDVVLVNRTRKTAAAVATDIRYGLPLSPRGRIADGDYAELAGCGVVMITAGVNEKSGGATDRNDPEGRLRLLATNAGVYRDIVPRIVAAAPEAVLLVVTDPPDPLADIAREAAGHARVVSAGTFLDSQRFRVHLAQHFDVDPATVEAQVLGEHGTSQVFVWSTARVGGVPVEALLTARGEDAAAMRRGLEKDVRYANITIIEGNGASQYGIAVAACRLAEMMLNDERAAVPVGSRHARYGVTLSLPSVVGRGGIVAVLPPALTPQEDAALEKSAAAIARALERAR